jgi:hypothetical protein
MEHPMKIMTAAGTAIGTAEDTATGNATHTAVRRPKRPLLFLIILKKAPFIEQYTIGA